MADKFQDLRWAIDHYAGTGNSIPINRSDASALLAERDELKRALSDAAMSLETIAEQAGRDEGMQKPTQFRGYAENRASVARFALSRT